MQLAVLFRLAVDAGRAVSYREIVEDVWGLDGPENERAALQSVVSRLRSQLPTGSIESTTTGYRLAVAREHVDALVFADLVAASSESHDPARAARALELWVGEPWIPSANFDWFERDLRRDHATAVALCATPVTSSIPAPLTEIVGRADELALVAAQLESNRLVTIIGTGGAGKTRLAIETGRRSPTALLVELAPVGAGEVLSAVLTSTGREIRLDTTTEASSTRERVIEALYGRDVLMVLDNCEHVVDEAARVAEDLLSSLPSLRILATSREPLAVPGEAFVAVGSLPHPATDQVDDLADFAAVELFRQRAVAARGLDLADEEIVTAARITTRLDGLPLAIELAAAKLRTMTLDEVLTGLENRFALLTGGRRTGLPRHQTLRAMIDWSWSLLSDDERLALTQLAVFPAGIDAGDTAALASAIGLPTASVLDSLVDRSLLQRSRGRYRTLETIREYGIERLAEQGRAADARAIQARHQASRAVEFDSLLRGPHITRAIAWFDAEEDNISAALRFAIATGAADLAVELIISSSWYWIIRDRGDDAQQWFAAGLPLVSSVDTDAARVISLIVPVIEVFGGEHDDAADPGDRFEEGKALLGPLASVKMGPGSHDVLQVIPPLIGAFAEAASVPGGGWMTRVRIPHGEDLGLDPWPSALMHVAGAALAQNRGDIATLGEESAIGIAMFERIGDLWGLALGMQMRAEWLNVTGRLAEALAMTDASTANMRLITSSWDLAQQQTLAITVLMRLGRLEEARARVAALLAEADATGNVRTILQATMTAITVDIQDRDTATAERRVALVDELTDGWPGLPPQFVAWNEVSKAGISMLRDDLDAAEIHLRAAADGALASHDYPVIGLVAINLGSLAVARGDIRSALRAVDLSTALIGAYDAANPLVVAIEKAAGDAGIERASADALTRPMAIDALKGLVSGD
jgi:predicted ATPase